MKIFSKSEEDTFNAGVSLAKKLVGGEIITLDGDLGAGKTVFTKGIASGLGVRELVLSPTFTIMNEHSGDALSLYHYDAYRLSGGAEAYEAGLTEYFGDRRGVCVIEWYTNILDALDGYKTINVCIDYVFADSENENCREITING